MLIMTQGIYKLTNNINDKVYVGQSRDIYMRFDSHMNMLWNKNHHSYKLQKFYNDNPGVEMDYEILEEVEHEKYLLAREKHYIDLYNSCGDGYNVINPKYYDKENNRYTKFENAKDEFEYLVEKYSDNIILRRQQYAYTTFDKINSCIEYFVRNYKLDDYMCEISQYKWNIKIIVTGIYFPYYKDHYYDSKQNQVVTDLKMNEYVQKHKKVFLCEPSMSKFSNKEKSVNKFIWFIKRYAELDSDIVKLNTLKYTNDRISIPFKIISEIIGYEGSNFRDHIIRNDEVIKLSSELGISYPLRKGTAEINTTK